LIIDEWNYDSGENILAERKEKAYISASFIPARLRNMYEADINYQVFFSLEDFQDNKEGVARNVGVFWADSQEPGYSGGSKASYNVFRFLGMLGSNMYISPSKLNDDFCGILATRSEASYIILVYNYIDPDIFRSFLSRNIATVGEGERRTILEIFGSERLEKIKRKELDINSIQAPNKAKNLLKKALELDESGQKFIDLPRQLKLTVKNLKNEYLYTRYSVDSSCSLNCELNPTEEKTVNFSDGSYSEKLILNPYSVQLIIFRPKPAEAKPAEAEVKSRELNAPAVENPQNATAAEAVKSVNVTSGK